MASWSDVVASLPDALGRALAPPHARRVRFRDGWIVEARCDGAALEAALGSQSMRALLAMAVLPFLASDPRLAPSYGIVFCEQEEETPPSLLADGAVLESVRVSRTRRR